MRAKIVGLCVFSILLFSTVLIGAQDSSVAIVTDKNGQTTTVMRLTAYYVATGNWIRQRPSFNEAAISFVLFKEDGVSIQETIKISFSEISRIEMDHIPTGPLSMLYIKKRDGSSLRLTQKELMIPGVGQRFRAKFSEMDAAGKEIRSLKPGGFVTRNGQIQGEWYMLMAFDGVVEEDGKSSSFGISDLDVKSIEFQ